MKHEEDVTLESTIASLALFAISFVAFFTYIANIVGTIQGEINTWVGVLGMIFPPVGCISGLGYLL